MALIAGLSTAEVAAEPICGHASEGTTIGGSNPCGGGGFDFCFGTSSDGTHNCMSWVCDDITQGIGVYCVPK